MAFFNLTVEDSSPLISYAPAGAWSDSPINDTLLPSYSGASLHTTTLQGASATINFNGTGISLFGAHRPNYGTYTISLDGELIAAGNSESSDNAFKQLLGSATGLSNGPHTVVLTNSASSPIDIDYLEIQHQIGDSSSLLTTTTIDDSDSRIVYTPLSDWKTNDQNMYMGGTLHFTQAPGASASVSFSGEAVALYGTVSQDHANLQVSLDEQSVVFGAGAGGLASSLHPQVLLYFVNGLGSGQHNLSVVSDPGQGTGAFMDVDAIIVYSTTANPDNNDPIGDAPSSNDQPSILPKPSGIPTKTLVAAIVGGVIGLILLLALIFVLFLWRRRRRSARATDLTPPTPVLPIQRPDTPELGSSNMMEGPPVATFARLSQHSIAPSYYSAPQAFLPAESRGPSRASSFTSTTPMLPARIPSVNSYAKANRAISSASSVPVRPSQRPPPLDLGVLGGQSSSRRQS